MNQHSEGSTVTDGERTWKAVYTIIERDKAKGRNIWIRVGTAFLNKDQSMNVRLDAMPINGMLHIRDYTPPEEGRGSRRSDDMFAGAGAA